MALMDFQTKAWVCSYMVSLLPIGNSLNVLEPTPGKGNLVKALLSAGHRVTAPADFWKLKPLKWDAVVMNPPFTPMLTGYRILFRVLEMTSIVIALMPWLTLINSERRTEALRNYGIKSVTHLPRSAFNGSRVQTCILLMEKGYCNETSFHFLREEKTSKGGWSTGALPFVKRNSF